MCLLNHTAGLPTDKNFASRKNVWSLVSGGNPKEGASPGEPEFHDAHVEEWIAGGDDDPAWRVVFPQPHTRVTRVDHERASPTMSTQRHEWATRQGVAQRNNAVRPRAR